MTKSVLGIIGGSGIYDLPGLDNAREERVKSPWGDPSAALRIGEIAGQPVVFLSRLREAISVESFEVGMIKAPFMAFVIGLVACVEGLQVQGSAESLGEQTTNSVVKSIFLVIVLDGIFAMFFASIGM